MDEVTISYSIATDPAIIPNNCKASTDYKSQAISAHGANWNDAKENALSQCRHLKALGEPPADEEVDLDPPEA